MFSLKVNASVLLGFSFWMDDVVEGERGVAGDVFWLFEVDGGQPGVPPVSSGGGGGDLDWARGEEGGKGGARPCPQPLEVVDEPLSDPVEPAADGPEPVAHGAHQSPEPCARVGQPDVGPRTVGELTEGHGPDAESLPDSLDGGGLPLLGTAAAHTDVLLELADISCGEGNGRQSHDQE